jgi:CRP-like cAMP-binding protein
VASPAREARQPSRWGRALFVWRTPFAGGDWRRGAERPALSRAPARARCGAKIAHTPGVTSPHRVTRRRTIVFPSTAILSLFRQTSAFDGLTDDEVDALTLFLQPRRVAKFEALFREGDEGGSMFLLLDGELSVNLRGDAHGVSLLSPGDVIGEQSCLDPAPRSATLIATRDTLAMELTRPGLERIALALPRVASCLVGLIVRALSRRLRAIDERIESELGGDRTGLASRPASSPPASAPRPLSESARAPRVTVQTLRETGRLEAFTDADLDALLGATSVCTFAPGEMICLQGRAVAACYIVVSGVVAVVKEADGGTRCLTTLGPGTIAGQFGMLDRSPRVVGLRAETGVVALELSRDVFERLTASSSPLGYRFRLELAVATGRLLRDADQRLSAILVARAKGVAAWDAARASLRELRDAVSDLDVPVATGDVVEIVPRERVLRVH